MRRPRLSLLLGVSATTIAFGIFAACGGGERPPPGFFDREGGDISEFDGSRPSEGGGGKDATTPSTCSNTVKDGTETDTDCGGSVCSKCIDGKTCVAKTDCAGGSCINQKCATPACTNATTDGDETDTDCGGVVCSKCTTGKRCLQPGDCVSGACTGGTCRCPKGMTEVSRAGGNGAYCVDEIEVTKFQYNKFLTANVPITDQSATCAPPVNTTFVPRGAWPPAVAPPNNLPPGQGLAFNYALPVHYVDWCDAHAYCRWAGKQLCGGVSGGAVAFDKADQADAGAWYNACSAQGEKPWPYGTIFEDRCNGGQGLLLDAGAGGPSPQFNGYGFGGANQDLGLHFSNNGDVSGNYSIIQFAQCQGGATGLYHMAGNVAEWEDACDGALPTSLCRVRGGSYKSGINNQSGLSCAGVRTEARIPADAEALADIGFRCCLY